jgi:hypothetical protein
MARRQNPSLLNLSRPLSYASAILRSSSNTFTIPNFNPAADDSRCKRIWGFHRASKESCLLWKIMFHANATQRWRYPKVSQSDPLLQCALGIRPNVEDEQYLFWSCSYTQRLCSWINHLLFLQSHSHWVPLTEHALLGNILPRHICQWQHWWDLLRGSLLWHIWLHSNALIFQNSDASNTQISLACKVWAQMQLYMRIDFNTLRRKLHTANPEQSNRLQAVFKRTWGSPPLGPHICLPKVDLPAVPALALLL